MTKKRRSFFNIPFSVRMHQASKNGSYVALRSECNTSRRFELYRTVKDMVWSDNDVTRPNTTIKSARQEFQRAFAPAYLCPFVDVHEYINTDNPDEEDVQAAAHDFHVSERLVQTVRVDNNVLDRHSLEQLTNATWDCPFWDKGSYE